jgi:ornithine cyclodeaminase/alanine dehydrogenase-like protein (mu-crystallin family)
MSDAMFDIKPEPMPDAFLDAVKAQIIQLVKDGFKITDIIRLYHWSEDLLAKFGLTVDDEFIRKALDGVWDDMAAGKTSHAKKYDYPDPNELGNSDGAMVGRCGDVTGSKVITFRKDNDAKGLPASFCDAMLRTLTTGFRFFTCEAISGSDGRTGWFAAAFHAIAMRNRTNIVGFIVGNGSVGQSCLRHINLEAPKAYKIFHVMARNVEKNKKIVDDLQPTIDFPLKATEDRNLIRTAKYLITAASGDVPVVSSDEVDDDTDILSQGRNDLPPELIARRIEDPKCIIVGDSFKAMDDRNVDPLAKYHSARGEKLSEVARAKPRKYVEYATLFTNPLAMELLKNWTGTFLFLPVGLFAYDAKVVMEVYRALIAILEGYRTVA